MEHSLLHLHSVCKHTLLSAQLNPDSSSLVLFRLRLFDCFAFLCVLPFVLQLARHDDVRGDRVDWHWLDKGMLIKDCLLVKKSPTSHSSSSSPSSTSCRTILRAATDISTDGNS